MFYEVQKHIELLENYIKAPNKQNFLKELKHPSQKLLLQVLTTKIDAIQPFKKYLSKLQVGKQFQQQILKYKLRTIISQKDQINDKELLKQLKELFLPYSNFNYPKPVNARRDEMIDEGEDSSAKIAALSKNTREYINEKVSQDIQFLSKLDPYGWTQLTEKTILNLQLKQKQKYFRQNRQLYQLNADSLDKILNDYLREYKKEKKITQSSFEFSFPFGNLTKQQLNTLANKNKDLLFNTMFAAEWIRQNYSHFLSQYNEASSHSLEVEQNNLKELSRIYNQLSDKNESYFIKQFQVLIGTQILATEIQLKSPSYESLEQYLKNKNNNLTGFPYFTQKFANALNQRQQNSNKTFDSYCKLFLQDKVKTRGTLRGIHLLLEDYIVELFKKELATKSTSSIEKLSDMIQLSYLKKMESKVNLMSGESSEQATDYWQPNQLVMFKQKKEIKIGDRNKTIYKTNDQVVLNLILKNIKKLQIKVYEINLLKEYLTNNSSQSRVYDDLNLSYFSPTFTDQFVNPSHNPFEYREVSIKVKDIPNKLGLFIVDFQGQGIVSRAIIRKGCIICLENYSFQGQTFCFYDEQGNELTESNGLEVWVEKQKKSLQKNFFNSNILDVQSVGDKTEIIAGVGCFAQKYIKQFKRNYSLNINAIYSSQSFISGNKAKVILKGALKLNSNQIALKKLKKIKAIVNQIGDKVIISSNTYQISEWNDLRDLSLQFLTLRDISSITIQVKAEVLGEKQCFIQSNKIEILITSQSKKQEEIIAQPYLTQLSSLEYQLHLKGKNGEPIKQSQVNLDFRIKGTTYIEKLKFFTNEEGKVNLGSLASVSNVSCVFNNQQRTWNVDRSSQIYCYDTKIFAFPGQELQLPVDKSLTLKDIFLVHQLGQRSERLDETHLLQLQEGLLRFKVNGLKSSTYKLTLIPTNTIILIEVVSKGNVWQGEKLNRKIVLDATQQKIRQFSKKDSLKNLQISKLSIENRSEDSLAVKFDISNVDGLSQQELSNLRFHVFALNYLSPNIYGSFTPFQYFKQSTVDEESRQLNKSAFLSNKILSEEAAYIFNRQKEKNRIGSNLQKPGIFLKRLAVRQTQNVVGELAEEGDFQKKQKKGLRNFTPNNPTFLNDVRKQKVITQHNSFFLTSGFVKQNVSFGEVVEIPKNYNHIQVYLITPDNGSKYVFNIADETPKNKDIRFKGLPQSSNEKLWNISQQAYNLRSSQTKLFQKQCEYKIITLAQVFQYAEKIILANKGDQKLYSWKDKLLLWQSFTFDQKVKLYNKFYSHQLNTFIKFKDQKFFEEVVRPYISNKFKKSIIDLCLLQDPSALDFLQIKRLNVLNGFESALLVRILVKFNKKQLAERVVKRLKLQQQKSLPFKVNNKNFDYIINSFAGKQQLKPEPLILRADLKPQMLARKLKRQTSECGRSSPARSEGPNFRRDLSQSQSAGDDISRSRQRNVQKKKKLQVDSTKQYTEHTFYYDGKSLTYPQHQRTPINSIFWVELAEHFLNGGNGSFTSSSFTEFGGALQTMLAAAFIPGRQSNLYSIEEEGSNYKLSAKIDLLLFVKELKQYAFTERSGMYIYQAISSPSTIQAGKEIAASQTKSGQTYNINTIFNNSTSESLQLQVLSPIPEGAVALDFKEISLIQVKLGPYSTHIHKQKIYFPESGAFKLHTANILNQKENLVVSHSQAGQTIKVVPLHQTKTLETFEDILRFGTKSAIIQFLKTKNIFLKQIFNAQQILWMLNDQNFFNQVLPILKQRLYFQAQIWKFGFLHGHCKAIAQYIEISESNNTKANTVLYSKIRQVISNEAFEYYPYFQKRAHRYANQNRSAIKNADLKQSYIRFLIALIVSGAESQPKNILAYAYYLVLQDRLVEAQETIAGLSESDKKTCEIQLDYLNSFLDIGLNGINCELAKAIAPKYLNYPIKQWRILFQQILQTLKEPPLNETEDKQTVETKVILAENGDLHIHRSTKNQICIEIFPTNLELFYSQHSFDYKKAISDYSISKPAKQITISSSETKSEIIIKKQEFSHINNPYLEVIEHSKVTHRRIKSIFWTDPRIQVKLYEQEGVVQIFTEGKRAPASYVKVFSVRKEDRKGKKAIFYVDGYTDITGKFKYALTDLSVISSFALLIVTQVGSIIKFVSPPKVKEEAAKNKAKRSPSSSSSSSDSHPGSDCEESSFPPFPGVTKLQRQYS